MQLLHQIIEVDASVDVSVDVRAVGTPMHVTLPCRNEDLPAGRGRYYIPDPSRVYDHRGVSYF